MMKFASFSRLVVAALACLVLADTSLAQGFEFVPFRSRPIPPPFGNGIASMGGYGNTQIMGSADSDTLEDPYPADIDVFHDGPGGADGKWDEVNATDGDGLDILWVGGEDFVLADPGDTVHILPEGGGTPLWSGPYSEYQRLKALARWIRDRLQALFAESPMAGEPEFWPNAFLFVSAELAATSPDFVGEESLAFSDVFAVGPYVVGDVPESPHDCLNWLPYVDDPLLATAAIDYTAAQYASAVAGAQTLLGHLIEQVADE